VAGFVVPGTRVDVLLTGNPVGGNERKPHGAQNVASSQPAEAGAQRCR